MTTQLNIQMSTQGKLPWQTGKGVKDDEPLRADSDAWARWPPVFAVFSLVMGALVAARSGGTGPSSRPTSAASSRPGSRAGIRFPVKYYLTAMLFIVFDIEIIFLYPWAVVFDRLGVFGLVEMVTFIATVLVAYVYVWRRGGLEWD